MNGRLKNIIGYLQKRMLVLLCLCIVWVLGFWMWRYYDGWGRYWVRYYFSGAVYEVFWCLVLFFLWPGEKNVFRIPVAVFVGTCALEFLQLWKPAFLQWFRSTLLGAALIGTDFVWLQFLFYVLGAAASVFLLTLLEGNEHSLEGK